VEVVNELGIRADDIPDLFRKLHSGRLTDGDVDPACRALASDTGYRDRVCRLDCQVARFNADTRGPDPCRSEGKVLILATIHDTFPIPQTTRLHWVACRDLRTAQQLKRDVYLKNASNVPTIIEYMDRSTVDVVDTAGRGIAAAIHTLGMANLGSLWALKLRVQALPLPLADRICDLAMWYVNSVLPRPLGPELTALSQQWDHHLLVELPEYGNGELAELEARFAQWVQAQPPGSVEWRACTPKEKDQALVFRFVTAAAFRTYCVGRGLGGLSLDYSLPKCELTAPKVPDPQPQVRMRYSHFGCNVVHEDLAYAAGVDTHAAKHRIKGAVEGMRGRLPAEHGHGTEYTAPPDTQTRWKAMDPTNTMNPGVGGLSYLRGYAPRE